MTSTGSKLLLGFVSIAVALGVRVVFPVSVEGEAKGPGAVVRAHQEKRGSKRPEWVESTQRRAKKHVKKHGARLGGVDAEIELALNSAEEDDLGQTHLRLDQIHRGVPVFGSQLIVQLSTTAELEISGSFNPAARIDTSPSISAEAAVELAKASVNRSGPFSNTPEAVLVILPNRDGTEGAKLTYLVELFGEDPTEGPAAFQVFIDALDGRTVWQYDRLTTGTGFSLYSGTVALPTSRTVSNGQYVYGLQDFGRRMQTRDMRGLDLHPTISLGSYFWSYADVWGNGALNNTQSAAVDAHFGAAKAWDYFYYRHGRYGLDNAGSWVTARVHYGTDYPNANSYENVVTFGDGDGLQSNPWVSLDMVGHEITHSVITNTVRSPTAKGLIYVGESGAANESFADIFGTAIEFYGGIRPDYAIGEDFWTPFVAGDALRSLSNPVVSHYAYRHYPTPTCIPDRDTNDNCGVHFNSGIQNKVFYLLANGGTHFGVAVQSIGRINAERVFYRALFKLSPSATFTDVRRATQTAAADLFGGASPQYVATVRAWDSVGVPR